ncbi:MAG: twin-arginine translocase TatA/TatE family subunit [Bacteroidota bacterium]
MSSIFLINFFGPEMIVIFFAILLLFGGKKIPELMRGIGKGIREFNTARGTLEKELKDGMRDEDRRDSSSSNRSRDRQDIFAESERRSKED